MHYMLDTNICIYIIKKKPANVLKKFSTLSVNDICISSVTLAELKYGVEKSQHVHKNALALDEFILPLEIMPFDEVAAEFYGKMRALLEKKGLPLGPMDLMIASHAQALRLTVVTNNCKEFSRVPNLKIENWA